MEREPGSEARKVNLYQEVLCANLKSCHHRAGKSGVQPRGWMELPSLSLASVIQVLVHLPYRLNRNRLAVLEKRSRVRSGTNDSVSFALCQRSWLECGQV